MAASSEPVLELAIASASGSYPIRIGWDLLDMATLEQHTVVVSDRRFEERFRSLGVEVIAIDASEENKRLTYAESLILALREANLRRGGSILAVGGGVVQDLTTLAASLYMRGVDWVYVPTTLMAMVDSCIGGKSSINAGKIKNLVGNIYPPTEILIDASFADSLRPIDVASGLSEAVKIVFCRGKDAFEEYLDIAPAPEVDRSQLPRLIHHTLSAKKWFIEIDEFDHKERRLLNFGHTFGHAIEVATMFALPHGIAVSLGMVCALDHVAAQRDLTEAERALHAYVLGLAVTVSGLSTVLDGFDLDRFEHAFLADKKHTTEAFRLVLPVETGGVELVSIPATTEHAQTIIDGVATTIARVAKDNS